MGVWSAGEDGTDINAVDRLDLSPPSNSLLAVADDRGRVSLLNFPCVVSEAPRRVFSGHCSHVAAARFNADGSLLVTCGGHDRTTFLWRVLA